MSIVADVDFGTLNVRVSLFNKDPVCIGSGAAEYPLNRSAHHHNFATQSHAQMEALEEALDALSPPQRLKMLYEREAAVYDRLYSLYGELYSSLGLSDALAVQIGHVLPSLRQIAIET